MSTSTARKAAAGRSFDQAAAAQMEQLIGDLRQMYRERNDALQEVARAHHEALLRLSMAADFKDDDTGVHIMRIAYLAEAMAQWVTGDAAFARLLRNAAPMHDIGKIGIPDSVLKKPGKLTPEEREVMKGHPAMGAQILGASRIPLFHLAAEVARAHHERWDGTGYPAGLAGEAIPLSARIVAVVDFFDALTMDRVYRAALPDEQAIRMLTEESGHAFDPAVVAVFLDHVDELIAIRERVNAQRPTFAALLD